MSATGHRRIPERLALGVMQMLAAGLVLACHRDVPMAARTSVRDAGTIARADVDAGASLVGTWFGTDVTTLSLGALDGGGPDPETGSGSVTIVETEASQFTVTLSDDDASPACVLRAIGGRAHAVISPGQVCSLSANEGTIVVTVRAGAVAATGTGLTLRLDASVSVMPVGGSDSSVAQARMTYEFTGHAT